MSSNVLLYSSHAITEAELAEVILEAGGVLTPEPEKRSFGGIIDGETYVWIDIIPCYDGVFDAEGNPDEEAMASLEPVKVLLGGEFQTWVYIALTSISGSQRLAVRFAHTCCQRWPCVVENNEGQLFSCTEIEQLYQEGGGFSGYGL